MDMMAVAASFVKFPIGLLTAILGVATYSALIGNGLDVLWIIGEALSFQSCFGGL
jgi:hypothetical protein